MSYSGYTASGLQTCEGSSLAAVAAASVPVAIFVLQAWVASDLQLYLVLSIYTIFLIAYAIGACSAFLCRLPAPRPVRLSDDFEKLAKLFVAGKVILTVYFFLLFTDYFLAYGYHGVRAYMMSEGVQSSRFYFAPFMYLDAYVYFPTTFIVMVALYIQNNKKLFWTLLACDVLHHLVFYAGRMVLYNLLILILLAAIHQRVRLKKIAKIGFGLTLAMVIGSELLLLNRDTHFQSRGSDAVTNSMVVGVGYYHIISPMIFSCIMEESVYFRENRGYGLATLGFITDPAVVLLGVGDKNAMPSKRLSAAAQNYILWFNDEPANAFTSFLLPAVFDFGTFFGPLIYGLFFGFLIPYSYRRRDPSGFVLYVILGYFLYFNSFFAFITGEWFWVLLFVAVFFRPQRSAALMPAE